MQNRNSMDFSNFPQVGPSFNRAPRDRQPDSYMGSSRADPKQFSPSRGGYAQGIPGTDFNRAPPTDLGRSSFRV